MCSPGAPRAMGKPHLGRSQVHGELGQVPRVHGTAGALCAGPGAGPGGDLPADARSFTPPKIEVGEWHNGGGGHRVAPRIFFLVPFISVVQSESTFYFWFSNFGP